MSFSLVGRKIALLFGGRGQERNISCLSAYSILKILISEGADVLPVGINPLGEWYIFSGDIEKIKSGLWYKCCESLFPTYPVCLGGESGFLSGGRIVRAELVIPALHGDFGEDGKVQGALDCAKIRYVGQGVTAGAICSDKAYTKAILDTVGIPSLPYAVYEPSSGITIGGHTDSSPLARALCERELGYPMFVKPCDLGSSLGAFPIYSASDFDKVDEAVSYSPSGRAIIEKMLVDKLELECAFLGGSEPIITAPGGVFAGDFYDFSAKYSGALGECTSARASVNEKTVSLVKEYSALAVRTLGLRDLARIDFFLSGGKIYFNEINTFPGFTEDSLYPKMLNLCGISYAELIARLVSSALERGV